MTADAGQNFLYSHKASEELARIVRRIEGKHNHFATDFMALPAEDGQVAIATRIEAWKNPASGLWQLDKFTRVPTGDSATIKKETAALPGLCFFDALHYCSVFEATEVDKGKHPLANPDGQWTRTAHWRAAAEAAHQAVDADGLVHPCAYGRVMGDGFFTEQELAAAQQSPAIDFNTPVTSRVPVLADTFLGEILVRSASLPAASDEDLIARSQSKQDLINKYQAAVAAGDSLCQELNVIYSSKFRGTLFGSSHDSFDKIGDYTRAIVTLGAYPAYQYRRGHPAHTPDRAFSVALKKFNACAEALPDSPEKQLCRDFNKTVVFSFWMHRAVVLREENAQKGKTARDGLPYLEKAAEAAGLSPVDLARLKNEYMAGKHIGHGYDSHAQRVWSRQFLEGWGKASQDSDDEIRYVLNKRIEQLRAQPG